MTNDPVFIQIILGSLGFLIVYTLMGIRTEIRDLASTMKQLENDMRGQLAALDRRVTCVEANCQTAHKR